MDLAISHKNIQKKVEEIQQFLEIDGPPLVDYVLSRLDPNVSKGRVVFQ